MTEQHGGDRIQIGNIRKSQGIAVGRGARADVRGNLVSSGAADVDPEVLRSALRELRAALRQANLPEDVQLCAETAAGNALLQGMKDGKLQPEVLVPHVQEVGETLKQANIALEEGSALWKSIHTVAPVLGPLVAGGAAAVASWFGVSRPM